MIEHHKVTLSNGLRVLVHTDPLSPMCTVNILYDVGSRDEDPELTGIAHLMEHLMFAGSRHVPDVDEAIESVGGYNNAFTNADLTNYYTTLPGANLETALWVEADRMIDLIVNREALYKEKSVVLEEFSETVISPPFGQTWHHLNKMIYQDYPYRWPTIGLESDHIRRIELKDIQEFYRRWYQPSNAILAVCGGVEVPRVMDKVEHYFGDIGLSHSTPLRAYPTEKEPTELRRERATRAVAMDTIFMAFLMPHRTHPDYETIDLLSDILCGSESSRLYKSLVKDREVCTEIDAYISGSMGPGMFLITAKVAPSSDLDTVEKIIWQELHEVQSDISQEETIRQIRMYETREHFQRLKNNHKAIELSYYELLGDHRDVNEVLQRYQGLTPIDLMTAAQKLFVPHNCSILTYHKK